MYNACTGQTQRERNSIAVFETVKSFNNLKIRTIKIWVVPHGRTPTRRTHTRLGRIIAREHCAATYRAGADQHSERRDERLVLELEWIYVVQVLQYARHLQRERNAHVNY